MFGARLDKAFGERGQLCVGIDPHPRLLREWGLPDDTTGLARFAENVIKALGDRIAVFKPQSAFFERHGSAGIAVLESTIRQLRDTGALIVLDVKRGDIGSTAAGYADAYLDPSSALYVDAITASPYLGVGSLGPMIAKALAHGGGVFVLARTSNPEAGGVQLARTPDGRTVAQLVVDEISQLNAGMTPMGSIGVVIGATLDETPLDLGRLGGPMLAPGLGAQGGTPQRLREIFGADLGRVLPSYSREVLRAGPDAAGLRAAAAEARRACAAALRPSS